MSMAEYAFALINNHIIMLGEGDNIISRKSNVTRSVFDTNKCEDCVTKS